ncbi:hypothetical protein E2C01_006401 [Portunus trituberculatus]|uniref:Single domain-containing protein n=1 Tax=Portunus trituberculatus TaxID=210409 RepID=A0A5B7CW80_PORTR|nr:hypothetical protein [Portunus trituberculatus]
MTLQNLCQPTTKTPFKNHNNLYRLCDSEIFNTTYRCVIQVDTTADFPRCCPTYKCNPDNLGNSV